MKIPLAAAAFSLLVAPAFAATIRDFQPMGFECESVASTRASIYLDSPAGTIYVSDNNGSIHRATVTTAIGPRMVANQFGHEILQKDVLTLVQADNKDTTLMFGSTTRTGIWFTYRGMGYDCLPEDRANGDLADLKDHYDANEDAAVEAKIAARKAASDKARDDMNAAHQNNPITIADWTGRILAAVGGDTKAQAQVWEQSVRCPLDQAGTSGCGPFRTAAFSWGGAGWMVPANWRAH